MNKQKTPEEKLLKLIRKKKKFKNESSPAEKHRHSKEGAGQHKIAKRQRVEVHVLKNVNRFLIVIALCLSGYGLAQLFFLINRDEPVPAVLSLPKRKVEAHKPLVVKERPVNVYLQEIERHDIFQLPWTVKPPGNIHEAASPDLNKELKLVGIVLDDDSKAVVVDLKTKQTLFLSEGEQVNGIFVEKISENKVLFLRNGRRIELVR